MYFRWAILPLALALTACGEGGDAISDGKGNNQSGIDTSTVGYKLQFSGNVLGRIGSESLLDVYAGNLRIGQANTTSDGLFSFSLRLDEATYEKIKEQHLKLVALNNELQLVKLLRGNLVDAIENGTVNTTISNFSTSAYILADQNDDGAVAAQEWKSYLASKNRELINQNLLRYATALTAYINKGVSTNGSQSLDWLTRLKTGSTWNQWQQQHQDALDKAWQETFSNPQLKDEAEYYLDLSESNLDNWQNKKDDILAEQIDAARCQLSLSAEDTTFVPNQGKINEQWQLIATLSDSLTGNIIDDIPIWSSSNQKTARVSVTGLLDLLKAGETSISASYMLGDSKCSDNLDVVVVESEETNNITAITIQDLPASMQIGDTAILKVDGTLSDKSTNDITSEVTWSALPEDAASFEGSQITALKAGNIKVVAQLGDLRQEQALTIKSSIPLAPELTEIRLKGYDSAKTVGESWTLQVIGRYNNNSEGVVTDNITWQSDNTAVATVNNGKVTAIAKGQAVITSIVGSLSQSVTVTVDAAEPVITEINIQGNINDLNKGEQKALTVYASYDNNQRTDITQQVSWKSDNSAIASISNGSLQGISEGTTTIRATWHSFDAELPVTVLSPALVSITPDILSGSFTLKEGEYYDQGIKLTLTDGVKDYSNQVVFAVSNSYRDESNLLIANVENGKKLRGLRAGTSKLILNNIPTDLRQYLTEAGLHVINSSLSVDFVVEDNPDVYQWHRHYGPVPEGKTVKIIQTITFNDTLYRFWQVKKNGVYVGVYLSTFDGNNHSKPEKILSGQGLISNEMIDGGGNGYTLLISPLADGSQEVYIYNLSNNTMERVDFTGAPFNKIRPENSGQAFGINGEGDLIVLDSTDSSTFTAYVYQKPQQSEQTRVWEKRGTVNSTQSGTLKVIQLPSYQNHLVVMDMSYWGSGDT